MADWTGVFARSALGATVFATEPAIRPAVRGWLAAQPLAHAAGRDPHAPAVDAWTVLDGGVLGVARMPADPRSELVPAGLYVVGFAAFRLLTADLGLARPARPLPGEPLLDADALRRAHTARDPRCPDAREQAELLATCTDRRALRLVTATLALAPAERGGTLAG